MTFGGYRVQHPLEPAIQIKVQTRSENPGPVQAVDAALTALDSELKSFDTKFREALKQVSKESAMAGGGEGFGETITMNGPASQESYSYA